MIDEPKQAVVRRESPRQQEALEMFLQMGPGRTLARLTEMLRQKWDDAPSARTIDNWSAWFGWQIKASEYDRKYNERRDHELAEWQADEYAKEVRRQVTLARFLQELGTEYFLSASTEAQDKHGNPVPRLAQLNDKDMGEARRLIQAGSELALKLLKPADKEDGESGGMNLLMLVQQALEQKSSEQPVIEGGQKRLADAIFVPST